MTGFLTLGPPRYNANHFHVAVKNQPFEVDMGYSSPQPPTAFVWLKNGFAFSGQGRRVVVDHNGIVFSRVLASDAGRYEVVSHSTAGTARAFTVIKGTVVCVCVCVCV